MKKINKNKFGIVLGTLLTVVMLFSPVSVFAEQYNETIQSIDVDFAETRAELFLKSVGHPSIVKEGILLENLNGEYEAVAFSMQEKGYIIVNLNDLSIPELSFENPNPYLGVKEPVYNGILSYYRKSGDEFISVKDNTAFTRDQFNEVYCKEKVESKETQIQSLESSSKNQLRHLNVEKHISGSLRTWYISGGHCGSIATAICMRYYYDYVNANYVPSNSISQNSLIALMQQYVGAGGTSTSDLVGGLNQYFADRNINNSTLSKSTFSFSTIKIQISNSRPVIIDTDNHPTYNEHWIIAHGYFTSPVDGDYVIVNNGWGSNNVWLTIDSGTLDDLVYFNN